MLVICSDIHVIGSPLMSVLVTRMHSLASEFSKKIPGLIPPDSHSGRGHPLAPTPSQACGRARAGLRSGPRWGSIQCSQTPGWFKGDLLLREREGEGKEGTGEGKGGEGRERERVRPPKGKKRGGKERGDERVRP